MKKIFTMISAVLLAVGMSTTAFAADINVTVDGTPVTWTDAKPFINKDDRTLVPLRPIANALGLEVAWNDDTNTASFTDGETTVEFTVDSTQYHVFLNNFDMHVYLEMDTKPAIADSRIFAPARYLAESFLYTVGWDQATQTVTIVKAEEPEEEAVQLPKVPAGEFAAASPATVEAGSSVLTYIAFDGVALVEDPDIFEYSIEFETPLNGLGFGYSFVPEEDYLEMDMSPDFSAAPGTYPVTFTIPREFFSDAKENIVVSTTLTVTAPAPAAVMAEILDDVEWGLWVGLGSQQSHIIDAIADETGWMLEDTPFELAVTNGDFVNSEEGAIEGFSCTLTVTNTETFETISVDDVLIPLYFESE